jgi:hypothetical protein
MYASIANAVEEAVYEDMLFLFEEAAFVLDALKSRRFVEIAFAKIWSLNGEKDFIGSYLENLTSLSRQELSLIIELAGKNVAFIIEPITLHLLGSVSDGEAVVTENCKFLLEICDLYQCQQDRPGVCEQLFDVLEQVCVSQENFKWLFQLQKKVIKRPAPPLAPAQPVAPDEDAPYNCDLYQCQQDSPGVCEPLFDVLEQVCSSQDFKWLFPLQKKVIKRPARPRPLAPARPVAPDEDAPCFSGLAVQAEPSHSSEGSGDRNNVQGPSQVGSSEDNDETTSEFHVFERKSELIRLSIPKIQEDTNTHVNLRAGNLVTIVGSIENVLKAEKMVRDSNSPCQVQ